MVTAVRARRGPSMEMDVSDCELNIVPIWVLRSAIQACRYGSRGLAGDRRACFFAPDFPIASYTRKARLRQPVMANEPHQPPTAAVLVIGDEILSGRTQDTNLASITKFLGAHGIDVCEARVVRDVEAEIVAALNALRARFTYVLAIMHLTIPENGLYSAHENETQDPSERQEPPRRLDPHGNHEAVFDRRVRARVF